MTNEKPNCLALVICHSSFVTLHSSLVTQSRFHRMPSQGGLPLGSADCFGRVLGLCYGTSPPNSPRSCHLDNFQVSGGLANGRPDDPIAAGDGDGYDRGPMISTLARQVERILLEAIRNRYQVEYEKLSLSGPARIELGDLALPVAFDLARKARRPPRQIAQELADDARTIPGVWKADVAGGGYLNLYLHRGAFALRLAATIAERLFGRAQEPDFTGKIIVEHTNINPNKAAHIGHLRNAALGDSFVRCLRFLGHTLGVQNYLDHTGVQVADVV